MKVNFGGFVPLSTVDWRGKSVCVVFLRGCQVRCHYCHNREIQSGQDFRDTKEILEMIKESSLVISGVIFSGGEPTMQKDALMEMAKGCRKMGLKVGIQTNGGYPDTLKEMTDAGLLDLVHLDIKTRWEHYPLLLKVDCDVVGKIKESFEFCKDAYHSEKLSKLEIAVTLFPGREDDAVYIAREVDDDIDIVLQQGIEGRIPPLMFEDLKRIGDKMRRRVRIQTREDGEIAYENGRILIADSIPLTDILQARRSY